MPIFIRQAGVWTRVKDVFVRSAGVWDLVQNVYTRRTGSWVLVHTAEVTAVIAANTNNLSISSLFTPSDWANPKKKKRVVINAGVVVGDSARTGFAIRTNSGRASTLVVENYGEIQGFYGSANSGSGGAAFYVDQETTIINNGAIRGGGGGGGRGGTGGTGGQGYYSQGGTISEGPFYSKPSYSWRVTTNTYQGDRLYINWNGSAVYSGAGNYSTTSMTVGSITYYRGASHGFDREGEDTTHYNFAVSRQYSTSSPVYTSGGAGGAGGQGGYGQGYGYGGSAGVIGSDGAPGGANAGQGGRGGTGGAGGSWGSYGYTGEVGITGYSGNYTGGYGGYAGEAGGSPGAAITGPGARTLVNNGTINGTT